MSACFVLFTWNRNQQLHYQRDQAHRMLDRVTIDKLRELRQANLDCYNVLVDGCERWESAAVADELRQLALEFGRNAEDLLTILQPYAGSMTRSPRSQWLELRGAFEAGDVVSVLAEAARMVDEVRQEYQESIAATRALSELLPKQYARVRRALTALRTLRVRQQHAQSP